MCFLTEQYNPSHYEKTHPHSILQVPTTQLAKMSIDPKSSNSRLTSLKYMYKMTPPAKYANWNVRAKKEEEKKTQEFRKLDEVPPWHLVSISCKWGPIPQSVENTKESSAFVTCLCGVTGIGSFLYIQVCFGDGIALLGWRTYYSRSTVTRKRPEISRPYQRTCMYWRCTTHLVRSKGIEGDRL